MKILFILPDFVLPTRSGLRVRELSQLRLLSAIDEVESITLLTVSGSQVAPEDVNRFKQQFPKIKVAPPIWQPSKIRKHPSAAINFVKRRLLHNEPYLAAIYNSSAMHRLVRDCLHRESYDLVYISYLGVMPYMRTVKQCVPGVKILLEQHNIEWQIFDRLADTFNAPMKQLVRMEAHALRRYERWSMQAVDSVIAISKIDAQALFELSGVSSVVVPPFFDISEGREIQSNVPRLGYMGLLGWQPNLIGLNWFCEKVWPLVLEKMPEAQLTIAGSGLTRDANGEPVVPASWKQQGIDVVGFVDDLEDLYRNTSAMIAPVIGGSGVRMKLLETMSAGMPTVTTPDGALGLEVEDERELLISPDVQGFADRVVRVLADSALRSNLQSNAYQFMRAHHSKEAAIDIMKTAILS